MGAGARCCWLFDGNGDGNGDGKATGFDSAYAACVRHFETATASDPVSTPVLAANSTTTSPRSLANAAPGVDQPPSGLRLAVC